MILARDSLPRNGNFVGLTTFRIAIDSARRRWLRFDQPSINLAISRSCRYRHRARAGRGGVSGVEVKAAATATEADFRGLRKLKDASGKRFVAGVDLYDGALCASFGDGMFAVPIRLLWERAG